MSGDRSPEQATEPQQPSQTWRAPDRADVGILFVGLLFALVVVELLEPLRDVDQVPAEGWAQLGLAFALTLLSWIGYHLSVSRSQAPLRAFNPPLLQLLLDVAMVVVYWLVAISYERNGRTHSWWFFPKPSAAPEAVFVAMSFALYVAWDHTSRWIHRSWAHHVNTHLLDDRTPYRTEVPEWKDDDDGLDRLADWKKRARPTWACLGASITVVIVAVITQYSKDRTAVLVLDASLFAIVIAYRSGKERASYPSGRNKWTVRGCAAVAVAGTIAAVAIGAAG